MDGRRDVRERRDTLHAQQIGERWHGGDMPGCGVAGVVLYSMANGRVRRHPTGGVRVCVWHVRVYVYAPAW